MKIFKKIVLTSSVISFTFSYSQTKKDSIPQKVLAYAAEKFPIARDFNIEFTQLTPYKFTSKLHDVDQPENKVSNFSQVRVSSNINLIKTKKWTLSTNLNYRYTSLSTENSIVDYPKNNDFHYHSETLSLGYYSKLFNKIMVYSANVSVDGSEEHFERVRGMATATMVLKANAKTKMTVGIVGIIDPSAQVPVIPTFSYEHKFDDGLILDIILPKKVLVRKNIMSNSRISLGTEMDNSSFYIYHLNKKFEFRQLELNSGMIYEQKLGNFIGTLKTGFRVTPNARIFEKTESFKDYLFEANLKPAFYFNIGLSYNPF